MSDEKYVGAIAAAKQAALIKAYVDSKMKKDFVVNITFDSTSAPAVIGDDHCAVFNASTDKTFAEISAAVAAGKNVYGMWNGHKWPLYLSSSTSHAFRGHIQLANLFGTVGLAIAICSIWQGGCDVTVSAGELPVPALDGSDDGKGIVVSGRKWAMKKAAVATPTANGLMSSADKAKLDGVEDGATKTIVDDAMSDTSTNPVQNKVVMKYIDSRGSLPPVSVKNDTMLIQVVDGAYALRTKESIFPIDDALDTESKNAVENGIIARRFEQLSGVTLPATSKRDGLMTAANYTKLSGIEAGATKTIVDATLDETSTNPVQNKAVKTALDGKAGTAEATTGAAGLMSSADKVKLDGVEDGATKTIVDDAMSDTSTNPVQNKVVMKYIDSRGSLPPVSVKNDTMLIQVVDGAYALRTKESIFPIDDALDTESKNAVENGIIARRFEQLSGVTLPATSKRDGLMTAANYTKLSGIEAGATKTIVDATLDETSTNPVQNKAVKTALDGKAGTAEATTGAAGLMSSADKVKLDGVEDGATKTIVDDAMSDTSTNPVQNKAVKAALDGKLSTLGGEISGHLSVGLTVSAEGAVSTGRTSTDTGIHFEKAASDAGRISHGSDPMTGVSPIARLKVASPTEDDDAATKAYVDGRAVRYDAAQTLTDAQKAQARENVDAASAFTPILTSPVMIRKGRATDSAGVYLSTIDIGEKHAEIRLEDVNENAPVAIANLRTPTGAGTDNYAATKGYVDSKVASGGGVTVDDAMSDTSTNPVQNKVVKTALDTKAGTAVATTSANGLMSKDDKTKLDGITGQVTADKVHDPDHTTDLVQYGAFQVGAQQIISQIPTVDDAMSDTSTNPVQNKTIKQYVDDHAVSLPLTLTYANGQATGAAYTDIRKAIERGRQIKLSVANTPDIIASNARNETNKSVLKFIHTDVGGDTVNIAQYTVTAQASGLTVNVKSHEIA